MRTLFLINILLSFCVLAQSQTTYYVDQTTGDDLNLGTLPSAAWKSITKVNNASLQAGDSILFKCNEQWRTQLQPQSGTAANTPIYYGKYGTGDRPSLLGSENYSSSSDWVLAGANIWRCTQTFSMDIGNVIFNHASSFGVKKFALNGLVQQNDYYYDNAQDYLYIYSNGNPASIYTDIELAKREHIVLMQVDSFITIENLDLRYGAAHGVSCQSTKGVVIRKCEMAFLGGGELNPSTGVRFGNGVEFWAYALDNKVEQCYVHDLYDTGLTNQNHTTVVQQENIEYSNNLIVNCGLASFEYWVRPSSSTHRNIRFVHNTCIGAGRGWGALQHTTAGGAHVGAFNNTAATSGHEIRNNIFIDAKRTMLFYETSNSLHSSTTFSANCYFVASSSDTIIEFYGAQVMNQSAYQLYAGSNGIDQNSIYTDPLLVDQNNKNYHLSGISPCIDAADNLGLTKDFEGNNRPVHNGYDIGTYEYIGVLGLSKIKENNKKAITVWPNPTTDYIQLNLPTLEQPISYQIINVEGRIVQESETNTATINVSSLVEGWYFLNIEIAGKFYQQKIQILN